jgi:hypothetical protein
MNETIEQAADSLVARYLNKAGQISCQFVIKLKQALPEVQQLVNTKLVAQGHPAYDLSTEKKRSRSRSKQEPRVLDNEGQDAEQTLLKFIGQLQIDRMHLKEFMLVVDNAERKYRQQLAELRGVSINNLDLPKLEDPYKNLYVPAHQHARHNKAEILASTRCACFFCRATFEPLAIMEYVENGMTALCPNCGIDSVIGDKAGFELSDDFLVAMFKRWFSIPVRLRAAQEQTEIGKAVTTVNEAVDQVAPQLPPPSAPSEEYTPPQHLLEDDEELTGIGSALSAIIPDGEDEDENDTP